MQAFGMGNFLSFVSLFKSREQHTSALANTNRFDKLLKQGVDEELLEWQALRHRNLREAEYLLEPSVHESTATPFDSSAKETRLAS